MKFTSSILLLVLPALSIARPSPQTEDQQGTSPPTSCVDGERRCDAGNTWSLCVDGRFVPQGVNGPDSECTELQVRGDNGEASVYDTMLNLKFVGDIRTLDGGIGIASAGEPKEYPMLAAKSMNITLIVKGVPDSDAPKNGTATPLRKRATNLHCVRFCMNGHCEVRNCETVTE